LGLCLGDIGFSFKESLSEFASNGSLYFTALQGSARLQPCQRGCEETPMTLLNCDMGESYGIWRLGDDRRIMPAIHIANVACGFHASDFNHMRATVQLAKAYDVKVGAHPSLPDLQGFGRREMKIGRQELANCLIYQIGALKGFLDAEGMSLNHIKPHGSLYGMAARDAEMAHAVCDAADVFKAPLLGMIGTEHEKVYAARGHGFLAEYYVDLDYADDGKLIITREHEAIDPGEASNRAVRALREGVTRSVGGKDIKVGADTICVHSDTPGAHLVAQAVHDRLVSEGFITPRSKKH
jgi:5-oxoprolinase (ATP-hydrolysing) subunit A